MAEQCVACDIPFRGNSRPMWAFDRLTGRLVGRLHTTDRVRGRGWRILHADWAKEPAQFYIWREYVRPKDGTDLERNVRMLAWKPNEALDEEQDRALTHWIRGPREMTFRQTLEVVNAHTAMGREYLAWLAEAGPAREERAG